MSSKIMNGIKADIKRVLNRPLNLKKQILLNLPYLFIFWIANKLAESYRLSVGGDLAKKLIGMVSGASEVLQNPLPSFSPRDLLVGVIGALLIKAIVYAKGKNAKKYRNGVEYGSARWGTYY